MSMKAFLDLDWWRARGALRLACCGLSALGLLGSVLGGELPQPTVRVLGSGRALAGYGHYARAVKVSGNHAFVANGWAGLLIFNVANPTNCVLVKQSYTPGFATDIVLSENFAYLADGQRAVSTDTYVGVFRVLDVSDPSKTFEVDTCDVPIVANGVAVADHYAYVACQEGGLQVVDVSDPTDCKVVGSYVNGRQMLRVTVSGLLAYVVEGNAGLEIIDVSDPTKLFHVGDYVTGSQVRDVVVIENRAYISDSNRGLLILDVSDPAQPRLIGEQATHSAISVAVSGRHAFVANYDFGLTAIEVSNPADCQVLAHVLRGDQPVRITVSSDRIYYVGNLGGLTVLPSIPNVQCTVRVDAAVNQSFTLEAATDLNGAGDWSPLLTTNVPAMPFDFVDFDVGTTQKPRKFYRVHQP